MAKNLVFYLELPLERKHEIIWILVKNNFIRKEKSQEEFYNKKGDLILLKYLNKTKEPYSFDVSSFENNVLKEKTHISSYEEIKIFIESFNLSKNMP